MTTVTDIVTAVSSLSPDDFLKLRQELERLEEGLWESELRKTTEDLKARNVGDDELDQLVLRRRRESRP
jgi:hypothetical protein